MLGVCVFIAFIKCIYNSRGIERGFVVCGGVCRVSNMKFDVLFWILSMCEVLCSVELEKKLTNDENLNNNFT